MDRYTQRLVKAQEKFPRLRIVPKSKSRLMKVIAWVLKNVLRTGDDFMTRFISTIGFTIYTHDRWEDLSKDVRLTLLEHELVHVGQFANFLFPSWLWPANVVLFSFAYLFCLPAFWTYRARAERVAYAHQLWVEAELGFFHPQDPVEVEGVIAWLLRNFTGPSYFWMWTREPCEKYFRDVIKRIGEGEHF